MSSRNYPWSKTIHNTLCYCLGTKSDDQLFQLAWRLNRKRNGVTWSSKEWILIYDRCYRRVEIQTGSRRTEHCRGQLKCDGTRAETRFRLSAKRSSPFISAGASVQSTTGSRGVRINGSNVGYTMFWVLLNNQQMQLFAVNLFHCQIHSTCFGRFTHPSSGVQF